MSRSRRNRPPSDEPTPAPPAEPTATTGDVFGGDPTDELGTVGRTTAESSEMSAGGGEPEQGLGGMTASERRAGAAMAAAETARREREAYSEPSRPGRRSSGWLPALLGGLLGGGVVAAAGAWYVTTQPFVPPVLLTRLDALEATRGRLDAVVGETASLRERSETSASNIGNLQSRLASVEQAGAAAPQRIGALEEAVRELRDRLDGARATTDTVAGDVRGRLDELRSRVDRLTTAQQEIAQAGGNLEATANRLAGIEQTQQRLAGELAQLRGGIEQVRGGIEQVRGASAPTADLAALRGSFDQLRADLQAGQQRLTQAQDALRQELAGVRSEIGSVASRQDSFQQLSQTLASLQQAGGQREAQIAEARKEVDAVRQEIQQRLASLQEQSRQALAEAQRQVAERARTVERANALSLAAYELQVALDRGGGIEPTAELVGKAAGEGEAELQQLAERLRTVAGQGGVPTLAELDQRLDAVAEAAAAPPPGQEPPGLLGQVRGNLGGLVDLRRADQDAPEAAAAIETAREALARGDLAAALSAVRPLAQQEGGNAAAREWVAAAERRQAVAEAAGRLAARAQTSLAASQQQQ